MVMRVTSFKLDDELLQALKYVSLKYNMTVSEIIRRGVIRYILELTRNNSVKRTRRIRIYGVDDFGYCFYNCFNECYTSCKRKVEGGREP